MMGITSDYRFIRTAIKHLGHLFPALTKRSGYFKRRDLLADTIEWLIPMFASQSPGWEDNLLLVDSTPVECARSRETVKRTGSSSLDDALANAANYGYCVSHSRFFYGLRLHTLSAPDGTPRAMILTNPKENERDVCLRMLTRVNRHGPLTVIGDRATPDASSELTPPPWVPACSDPNAKTNPPEVRTSPQSAKGLRASAGPSKISSPSSARAARTLHGIRARIASRLLTLAAAISLNHSLGRPSRQLADLVA
jgi:hypothetical protein